MRPEQANQAVMYRILLFIAALTMAHPTLAQSPEWRVDAGASADFYAGRFDRAFEVITKQAKRCESEAKQESDCIGIYRSVAAVGFRVPDLRTAEDYATKAASLALKNGMQRTASTVDVLLILTDSQRMAGKWDRALAASQKALEIADKLRPFQPRLYHAACFKTVEAMQRLDRSEQHLKVSKTCLTEITRRSGPGSLETAYAQLSYGYALLVSKRYADAEPEIKAALKRLEIDSSARQQIAAAYHNLGEIAFQTGRLDLAESYFRKVYELDMIDGKVSPLGAWSARATLAGFLVRAKRHPEEARSLCLMAARDLFTYLGRFSETDEYRDRVLRGSNSVFKIHVTAAYELATR